MSFSTTARMVAAIRKLECTKSTGRSPLIEDSVVERLINCEDIHKLKKLLGLQTATYEVVVSRCKFIDQHLRHLRDLGVKSVVLLGAGLDTRPYRLQGFEFAEVDRESTITMKQKLIEEKRIPLLGATHYINADLSKTLTSSNSSLGFDLGKLPQPMAIVAEGLLYYLPKEALTGLLSILKTLPRSYLIADFMDKDLLNKAGPKGFQRRIQENGESIQSLWGLDEFKSIVLESGIKDLMITDTLELIKKDFPDTKVSESSNHIAILSNDV